MAYFVIRRETKHPAYYVGHTQSRWWWRQHLKALWTERRTDPEVLKFTTRADAENTIGAWRDMKRMADHLAVVVIEQGRV